MSWISFALFDPQTPCTRRVRFPFFCPLFCPFFPLLLAFPTFPATENVRPQRRTLERNHPMGTIDWAFWPGVGMGTHLKMSLFAPLRTLLKPCQSPPPDSRKQGGSRSNMVAEEKFDLVGRTVYVSVACSPAPLPHAT